MQGELIEVGIGLVVIFVVLASVATAINEAVSRFFNTRSKALWASLAGLLERQSERRPDISLGFILQAVPRPARWIGGLAGAATACFVGIAQDDVWLLVIAGLLVALTIVIGAFLVDSADERPERDRQDPATPNTAELAATPTIEGLDYVRETARPTKVWNIPAPVFGAAVWELAVAGFPGARSTSTYQGIATEALRGLDAAFERLDVDQTDLEGFLAAVDDAVRELGHENVDEVVAELQAMRDRGPGAVQGLIDQAIEAVGGVRRALDQATDAAGATAEYVRRVEEVRRQLRAVVDALDHNVFGLGAQLFDANGQPRVADALGRLATKWRGTPLGEYIDRVVVPSATSVDEAVELVNRWFDAQMERLTDTYRRNAKYVLAGLGLFVAVVFNVNSLLIADALYRDAESREELAAFGDVLVEERSRCVGSADAETPTGDRADESGADTAGESTPGRPCPVDGGAAADSTTSALEALEVELAEVRRIDDLGVPLLSADWTSERVWLPEDFADDRHVVLRYALGALVLVGGYGITALAVSLGASFWFRTLKTLSGGRG